METRETVASALFALTQAEVEADPCGHVSAVLICALKDKLL